MHVIQYSSVKQCPIVLLWSSHIHNYSNSSTAHGYGTSTIALAFLVSKKCFLNVKNVKCQMSNVNKCQKCQKYKMSRRICFIWLMLHSWSIAHWLNRLYRETHLEPWGKRKPRREVTTLQIRYSTTNTGRQNRQHHHANHHSLERTKRTEDTQNFGMTYRISSRTVTVYGTSPGNSRTTPKTDTENRGEQQWAPSSF